MGISDKQLSKIRMIANGVAAQANRTHKWSCGIEARRLVEGARITVTMRAGVDQPKDALLELAEVADSIRNELRLEKTSIGRRMYETSESTFETSPLPIFQFEVQLQEHFLDED